MFTISYLLILIKFYIFFKINFDYFYEVEPIVAVRQMNAFLFQGGLLFERLHRKREFQSALI